MKIKFQGTAQDIAQIEEGTCLMLQDPVLHSCLSGKDSMTAELKVTFTDAPDLTVKRTGTQAEITCQKPSHYYRGLTWLLHNLDQETYEKMETAYFPRNGLMLDCSRNSVFTVEKVKSMIRILARMGMNVLMLYTEDTYEVKDEPYFGAYRGRYSAAEIREMDDYAQKFGVELVPCIQTLAHLHNALKWPGGEKIKDTADILQVGKEETYQFIERMLKSVKEAFHTDRVHLGMDEAVQLGLGNYLQENGYKKSSTLIREHCDRVLAICKKLDLKPMMWSDMYITSNTGGGYYEVPENADCSTWEKPDPNLGMVYWDYYNADPKVYEKMLRVHEQLSPNTVFAGGCWIWNGIAPNYSRSYVCTKVALQVCKKYQVQEVLCTAWQDNGAETPVDTILPGAALLAHLGFHKDFDQKALEEEFANATGGNLENFLKLDRFDRLFLGEKDNLASENPSKYLLYQDALLGIFDYHLQGKDAAGYYRRLAQELEGCVLEAGCYTRLFAYYHCLAQVLSEKADLGVKIKAAYDAHDLSTLQSISEEKIPHIITQMWKLKDLREDLWMEDGKPFGYELIDLRLGGVLIRLESCSRRLEKYMQGALPKLEELEGERLPYFGEGETAIENRWQRAISGADLTDTI